eukprot:Awhi_evm1s15337
MSDIILISRACLCCASKGKSVSYRGSAEVVSNLRSHYLACICKHKFGLHFVSPAECNVKLCLSNLRRPLSGKSGVLRVFHFFHEKYISNCPCFGFFGLKIAMQKIRLYNAK